jgi:hypothetical protein
MACAQPDAEIRVLAGSCRSVDDGGPRAGGRVRFRKEEIFDHEVFCKKNYFSVTI